MWPHEDVYHMLFNTKINLNNLIKRVDKWKKKLKLIKSHFKQTRRIYCGRNYAVMSDMFKVVTLSKGNGQQIIDVLKDTTYEDLEKQILYIFFSKWRTKAKNLQLSDLNRYFASFSGDPLHWCFQNDHGLPVGNVLTI